MVWRINNFSFVSNPMINVLCYFTELEFPISYLSFCRLEEYNEHEPSHRTDEIKLAS